MLTPREPVPQVDTELEVIEKLPVCLAGISGMLPDPSPL
jgi:hypothetical protein